MKYGVHVQAHSLSKWVGQYFWDVLLPHDMAHSNQNLLVIKLDERKIVEVDHAPCPDQFFLRQEY